MSQTAPCYQHTPDPEKMLCNQTLSLFAEGGIFSLKMNALPAFFMPMFKAGLIKWPLKGPGQWGHKQNIWLYLACMLNCPPEPLRCTYRVYALHIISATGCLWLWLWAETPSSLVSPYEAGQRWRQSTCTEQVTWRQSLLHNTTQKMQTWILHEKSDFRPRKRPEISLIFGS